MIVTKWPKHSPEALLDTDLTNEQLTEEPKGEVAHLPEPAIPLSSEEPVGAGESPTPEAVTTPILEQARQMAGTWITSEDGETAYREWMAFCEGWVRHRLNQTYFEIHDVAWWERVNAPSPPPHRTSAQLDQMAHDVCLEAWGQGRSHGE